MEAALTQFANFPHLLELWSGLLVYSYCEGALLDQNASPEEGRDKMARILWQRCGVSMWEKKK